MQRDPGLFTGKASPTHGYEVGGYGHSTLMGGHYTRGIPVAPPFDATLVETNQEFPSPLNGYEFQPSENCPKNFIIFDQTDNRSRVMFHPALAHKFSCQNLNTCVAHGHNDGKSTYKYNEGEELFSSHKEDTEDIDALLSSEEDEEDDVISTGRTPWSWEGCSPDSCCSMEGSNSRMMKYTSQGSVSNSGGGSSSSERKKERMRKMVTALRGIVPGGESMDTPAILDEAVRYLKSLKVEVKKLGLQNFDN